MALDKTVNSIGSTSKLSLDGKPSVQINPVTGHSLVRMRSLGTVRGESEGKDGSLAKADAGRAEGMGEDVKCGRCERD